MCLKSTKILLTEKKQFVDVFCATTLKFHQVVQFPFLDRQLSHEKNDRSGIVGNEFRTSSSFLARTVSYSKFLISKTVTEKC